MDMFHHIANYPINPMLAFIFRFGKLKQWASCGLEFHTASEFCRVPMNFHNSVIIIIAINPIYLGSAF